FSPCLGVVKALRLPTGEGVRVDSGVVTNSEVTPYFDSMIAKLIVHAKDRKTAISRCLAALNDFQIKGVKTTIPFDKAVLNNAKFQEGDFDTSFIEKDMESMVYREKDEELLAALFAANHFTEQNAPLEDINSGQD